MFKTPTPQDTTNTDTLQVLSDTDLDKVSGGVFWEMGMEWANDPFVRLEYPGISWPKGGAQWWA